MSLLNDMLRDLTHHQKSTETVSAKPQAEVDVNAHEQRELFYNTSTTKPLPRTLVPALLVFIVVLAMAGSWKFNFFIPQETSTLTSPTIQSEITASPTPLYDSVIHQIAVKEMPAQFFTESVIPEQSSKRVESDLNERIAALESAITNLSTVIASSNQRANEEFFEAAEPAAYAASTMIENAGENFVGGQEEALESPPVTIAEESVSIHEPFPQPAAVQGDTSFSIAPNVKWKDEQQVQQARQLIAQGQTDAAIEMLQRFIIAEEQPRESMKVLVDIFIERENTVATEALLEQATFFSVVDQTFYAAKLAIIRQQDTEAIELLEAHQDDAEKNENYRALLAGLYQRSGLHVEATNHYRRLLNVFGDKPAYWLGFALSQDALDQPQVAVQAYQRVNQYADLQPQVRTYVQQRITALQQ